MQVVCLDVSGIPTYTRDLLQNYIYSIFMIFRDRKRIANAGLYATGRTNPLFLA
jgi:hypothetical protein